jgi:Fic family protein
LLPSSFIDIVAHISALKVMQNARLEDYPAIFTELERIARVQSIKSSNAIEGIVTSDERIAAIVNASSAPRGHDEMEIAGYRDALDIVHSGYSELDIRESDILALHRVMLSYTLTGGGAYKSHDNTIIEIDALGKRSVRFAPTSADETKAAMEQLVLAYREARDDSQISPLLLTPCVVLDFLCIHPFGDGNGRMSRLLSLLLLSKQGFDAGKYVSFEEQISRAKADYYEALRLSSHGWHESANTYAPFIQNFLISLLACYTELDKRFATVGDKRITKTNRIEATLLNSLLPLSKAEIAAILPDVSQTTIEAVLGTMVREGRVRKVGTGRGTKYVRG